MRKTIVITGADGGIGLAAARRLSGNGHHVIVVGHTDEATQKVASELNVDGFTAEFANLSSVNELADTLLDKYSRIDVLANNAGIDASKERCVTRDGYERTFQVNYLAPFLLTHRLMEPLLESKATVTFTSSMANRLWGDLDTNDLQLQTDYSSSRAYGNSKLALVLLARELHRRYHERGLSSASFHPGVVRTNLASEPTAAMRWVYQTPIKFLMKTPEAGAQTMVYLAEGTPAADFASGEYFVKCKVAKPNRQAFDGELARRLWEYSEAAAVPKLPD